MTNDQLMMKKIRLYTVITIVVFVALFVVIWLVQNTFYKITVSGADEYQLYRVADESNERQEVSSILGYSIIPNSTSFIEAVSDKLASTKPINQRSFLIPLDMSIDIKPQKKVSKIGRNSQGCNIVNPQGNFTYKCSLPDKVIKYASLKSGNWENSITQSIPPNFMRSQAYQNGLILMSYYGGEEDSASSQLLIRYINPGRNHQDQVIDQVDYDHSDRLAIETDNSGGSSFVINNVTKGKLYYFKDLKSNPISLDRETHYNTLGDSIYCSLHSQKFSCFIGNNSHSPDSAEEQEQRDKNIKERGGSAGIIETYNFESEAIESYRLGDRVFESVCQSGSELVGLHQGDISVLELDGRNAKPHRIADRVNQLTCGDKPLFSSGNKLFYIDDQQAYLAFSSSRLNMSNIWSIGDRLGFNVFVATTPGRASDGVSHAYTIDLKTDHSGQRIEDFLPYLSDGTLPFFEMDYNDSVIYIQPSFTGISNHRTGRFSVDQNSFNDSKGIMESKLKSDGIDKFDRRVIFTTGQ